MRAVDGALSPAREASDRAEPATASAPAASPLPRAATGFDTAFTVAAQAGTFFLQLAGMAVLARLLTPADYGLQAMVLAVAGVFAALRDGGLSWAIQRDRAPVAGVLDDFFWFGTGLGVLLALAVLASAPFVQAFFGEPRAGEIALLVALCFLLDAVSLQFVAHLRREMLLRKAAVVGLLSVLVGQAAAIYAALRGAAHLSLAWGMVGASAAAALLAFAWCRWRPARPRPSAFSLSMLRRWSGFAGFDLVNYASRNADNWVIGKMAGAYDLGLYSRAYTLLVLPLNLVNTPLRTAAFAAIADARHDRARFAAEFERLLRATCVLALPFFTVLCLASDGVVALLLGPKWERVSLILLALALVGFLHVPQNALGVLFPALDRGRDALRLGAAYAAGSLGAFAVGAHLGGVLGVALAFSAYALVAFPLVVGFVLRRTGVPLASFLRGLRPGVLLALAIAAAGLALRPWVVGAGPAVLVPAIAALSAIIWLAAVLWLLPESAPYLAALRRRLERSSWIARS